jgi:hypothetical protein
MDAFFGCIQGITLLRRDAFGEHEIVHTCNRRPIQSKSTFGAISVSNATSGPKAFAFFEFFVV